MSIKGHKRSWMGSYTAPLLGNVRDCRKASSNANCDIIQGIDRHARKASEDFTQGPGMGSFSGRCSTPA